LVSKFASGVDIHEMANFETTTLAAGLHKRRKSAFPMTQTP
jgi:hypothetical protein